MMTTKNKLVLAVLAGLVVASGSVVAKDVTLNDGQGPSTGYNSPGSWTPWGGSGSVHDLGIVEDNEVEPTDETGQKWDLEALIWNTQTKWNNTTKSYDAAPNTKSMGILSGFNTTTGATSGANVYLPSDIFISLDGKPNPIVAPQTQGYHNVNNRTTGAGASFSNPTPDNGIAFEYVIHFNSFTAAGANGNTGGAPVDAPWTGAFTVYKLNANSTLRSVSYNQNAQSNPWRYLGGVSNGTATTVDDAELVATGNASFYSGLNNANAKTVSTGSGADLSDLGVIGSRNFKGDVLAAGPNQNLASHYYLEIPMNWVNSVLPPGNINLGGHITMGCGNDELVGNISFSNTVVPDGGTSMLLLGAGLTGLSLVSRRMARR